MTFPPKTFDYDEPPANEMLFRRVARGATVLDVGCASGKLGEKLRREKKCRVEGVEQDSRLAEKAKAVLDHVYLLDLNTDPLPRMHVECVILGDTLEHLVDPVDCLKRCREVLGEEGRLLLCVPNIANWQVRLNLLFGKWDYSHPITHWGHYHSFTLKEMKNMVEYCGYRVKSVAPRNGRIKLLGRIWPTLFAFQFVIEAVKK